MGGISLLFILHHGVSFIYLSI